MKEDKTQKVAKKPKVKKTSRRKFLKKAAVVAAGAVVAPTLFNIRTAKAKTTTWNIQTSWPGGIGLEIFEDWCNSIVEKTGGELAFKPFSAKAVVGEWQLFDAVQRGVLQAMNPFTLYSRP
jgi:TRAP-type mannitol/chloroaromatic compound transport system substrate-binding protein